LFCGRKATDAHRDVALARYVVISSSKTFSENVLRYRYGTFENFAYYFKVKRTAYALTVGIFRIPVLRRTANRAVVVQLFDLVIGGKLAYIFTRACTATPDEFKYIKFAKKNERYSSYVIIFFEKTISETKQLNLVFPINDKRELKIKYEIRPTNVLERYDDVFMYILRLVSRKTYCVTAC